MIEIDAQTSYVALAAAVAIGVQWGTNRITVATLSKKIDVLEAFDRVTNNEYHELNTQLQVLVTTVGTLSSTVSDLLGEVKELRQERLRNINP